MKNRILISLLTIFSFSAIAGTSSTQLVEGIITKIEGDKVTIVSQGKDVVVDKKFIPKDKLKAGKQVSIVTETADKK